MKESRCTYSDDFFQPQVLWPGERKRFRQQGCVAATHFAFLEETAHVLFWWDHLAARGRSCFMWECLRLIKLGDLGSASVVERTGLGLDGGASDGC